MQFFFNVLYIINAYIHLDKALIFLFCIARHLFQISGIHFQHTLLGQRKKQPISLQRETGCSSIFTNIRFQQY